MAVSSLYLSNESLIKTLEGYVQNVLWANTFSLRLYKSSVPYAFSNNYGTYMSGAEADFGGYAAIGLDSWQNPLVSNGVAYVLESLRIFTATGASLPQTIYGAFLTDDVGVNLLWAQDFPTPIVLSSAGDQIFYLPLFSFLCPIP